MLNAKYQYNEQQHSGVDFSNIDEVKAYDSYMQKLRDIKLEVERIKKAIDLGPNDTVLDIGTGTGELAAELALYCKNVFAIDISQEMLEYAAQKAEQRNLHNISFQHRGFLTCQFANESLDAIISQFVLHHLPEFWKFIALKKVYSMLKIGGKFYLQDTVFSSEVDDYDKFFSNAISQIEIAAGDQAARGTETTIKDEFPTLDWILEGLLNKIGFSIIQVEYSPPFIGTYVCIKKG